jgi:hypothetical protein
MDVSYLLVADVLDVGMTEKQWRVLKRKTFISTLLIKRGISSSFLQLISYPCNRPWRLVGL